MDNYIIFSIDNVTDTHTLAKFLRWIDTKRAMSELQSPCVPLVGMYQGKLEHSFMLTEHDFNKYVLPYAWVDNQECVMVVRTNIYGQMLACFRAVSAIWESESLPLRQVSAEEAMRSEGFTYRPDIGIDWVM